jgi:hypothetical protein
MWLGSILSVFHYVIIFAYDFYKFALCFVLTVNLITKRSTYAENVREQGAVLNIYTYEE